MTENTGDESESSSIDDFYAAMRKHYPFSDKLIASFIQHTNADQNLGHSNVFKEMCESIPPLTRKEVADAMNVAAPWSSTSCSCMDGIEMMYGNSSTELRVRARCSASKQP